MTMFVRHALACATLSLASLSPAQAAAKVVDMQVPVPVSPKAGQAKPVAFAERKLVALASTSAYRLERRFPSLDEAGFDAAESISTTPDRDSLLMLVAGLGVMILRVRHRE